MNSKSISVFIADDYIIVREGLKEILKRRKGIRIAGESENLAELPLKVKQTLPDILLMELNLCKQPLKLLINEIKSVSPQTKVLIISDCACKVPVITAIRGGISGFVKKNVSEDELFKAVNTLSEGKEYFTSEITSILVQSVGLKESVFSDRELEILRYICKGRSSEQIGDILFISEKTVITHKKNIMRKAGVKKSADLILWAFQNKLV